MSPSRTAQRARRSRGVTLVEIVIAIFILLVGIVSVVSVFPAALQLTARTYDITHSSIALKDAISRLVATQTYTFGAGYVDSGDSDQIVDNDANWRHIYDAWSGSQYGQNLQRDLVLIKKNPLGRPEWRRVRSVSSLGGNQDAWKVGITIDDDNNDAPYIEIPEEGSEYWIGNFRVDKEDGRQHPFGRIADTPTALDYVVSCERRVLMSPADDPDEGWESPEWGDDAWQGFVLMLTSGRAEGRVFLITENGSDSIECSRLSSPPTGQGLEPQGFGSYGVRKGDSFRIIGNAGGYLCQPVEFFGDLRTGLGAYETEPYPADNRYSYACIVSGWEENLPNLYRIDVLFYRNFNRRWSPEYNEPPVAQYATYLAGRKNFADD